MRTIVLFIRDDNLKMTVVRILMKNNFYYIEASTTEELFIKLELAKDAGLLIMDYKKEAEQTDLTTLVQANIQQLPTLLIMPDEYSYQLPSQIKQSITDIILTPFNANTLLRKTNAIINIQENRARLRKKAAGVMKLSADQSDRVVAALESASREKYSICIICLYIPNAFMELNLELLDKLKNTLRRSDQIIETDLGEFLILCPYTPLQALDIVKTKIRDSISPIVDSALSNPDIQISGTNYPEEIKTYNEIVSMLASKIS